jgi:hypothetical protein
MYQKCNAEAIQFVFEYIADSRMSGCSSTQKIREYGASPPSKPLRRPRIAYGSSSVSRSHIAYSSPYQLSRNLFSTLGVYLPRNFSIVRTS